MGLVMNSPDMPSPACIHPGLRLARGADRSQGECALPGAHLFLRPAERRLERRARVLATVMFTDIVESTRRAAELGDEEWSRLLDRHDDLAREIVGRYSGVLAKTTGDGVLATFAVPDCAVRCAVALQTAVKLIGLELRVGLHAGEVELRCGDVRGLAVHAAARVMRKCAPGEVLVSRAVADLLFGARLSFAGRGAHELKGLPGRWDLYAAGC